MLDRGRAETRDRTIMHGQLSPDLGRQRSPTGRQAPRHQPQLPTEARRQRFIVRHPPKGRAMLALLSGGPPLQWFNRIL